MADQAVTDFLYATDAEVDRARKLFNTPNKLLLALVEEMGEVAKELLKDPTGRTAIVREEFVQLSAMVARLYADIDPNPDRDTLELSAALGEYAEAKQDYGPAQSLVKIRRLRRIATIIEVRLERHLALDE